MKRLFGVYILASCALLINGYFGGGYPLTHFLIERGRFDDFFNSVNLARQLPSAESSYILSPGTIFIFRMIDSSIADYAFLAYNAAVIYILWSALTDFKLSTNNKVGVLFTYPLVFAVCRGNAELLTFSLLLKSLAQLHQGNLRGALTILLISMYIKPTSAIWLIVFPAIKVMKEWRVLVFFAYAISVSILQIDSNPILFFDKYGSMLKNYELAYVFGSGGDLFNNSLWGLIKSVAYYDVILDKAHGVSIKQLFRFQLFLVALMTIVIFYLLAKSYRKDLVIFSAALALIPTLISPVSPDYRLVYFIVPLVFLLKKAGLSKLDWLLGSNVLLILAPKHFIQFTHITDGNVITIQSLANPVLLVVLIILMIVACKRMNSNEMPLVWFN
jgi:hypothetical protein